MMLKVYQIYFKEEQLKECEYIPYLNKDCTPFFESQVIRDLIESGAHKEAEYFGVVSYKLRHKIDVTKKNWALIPNIANRSQIIFTPERFEQDLNAGRPDVMSFQRHVGHDTVSFADRFHPNFSKYFSEIMHKIGYDWAPEHYQNVFYCNYFVAKSEIYEKYVTEMLSPAMDVMQNMRELFNNSHYPSTLPDDLKQKWNINHYPYHAFIAERMFSYFAHIHKLKCLHY